MNEISGKRRRAGGWFEIALVALGASALTGVAVNEFHKRMFYQELLRSGYYKADAIAEIQPIADHYGPDHYSRNYEEWFIRDFFQDRRDGVFLDVGANHYKDHSNTYFLEKTLGWSGVAIDALAEFGPDYVLHRPKTRFVALFVSDRPGTIPFFVPEHNKLVASSSLAYTKQEGTPGQERQVPATTLNLVLEQAAIQKVDFMSMDIELAEPGALRGFDVERFNPDLVCIESHAEVRQEIADYFARHRYVVVAKYLRADTQNLYFKPLR